MKTSSKRKETWAMDQLDFDQIYKVVENYVRYCIRKPAVKSAEEASASEGEISKKAEAGMPISDCDKSKKNNYGKAFQMMCENVSAYGIAALSMYVDALKKLYETNSGWKKSVESALVDPKSLKLFGEIRSNISDRYQDFRRVLIKVNKTFQVDEYTELSLNPNAALYGSAINKAANECTKRFPSENEDIQKMLEIFAQVSDSKRLGEWLMSILRFTPDRIIEGAEGEFVPKRKELKEWAYTQIDSNDSYKSAVVSVLQKGQSPRDFVNAFLEHDTMQNKQKEMEERIKTLEADNAREKAEHEECCKKYLERITEQKARLEDLEQKVRDFDRCKQDLTEREKNYQAQIAINERIVVENERLLQDMEDDCERRLQDAQKNFQATQDDYYCMQDELSEKTKQAESLQEQVESLQTKCAALQADICLKDNEFQRSKEKGEQSGKEAKIDVMQKLVTGIRDQFDDLTMFYLELKETGKLGSEYIELYADTINKIVKAFADIGMEKIGAIEQKVAYDSSIHEANGARISNGEQVVVRGCGWKIDGDVYIKAPVEKGE